MEMSERIDSFPSSADEAAGVAAAIAFCGVPGLGSFSEWPCSKARAFAVIMGDRWRDLKCKGNGCCPEDGWPVVVRPRPRWTGLTLSHR